MPAELVTALMVRRLLFVLSRTREAARFCRNLSGFRATLVYFGCAYGMQMRDIEAYWTYGRQFAFFPMRAGR